MFFSKKDNDINMFIKFDQKDQLYKAYNKDGTLKENLSNKEKNFLMRKNKELLTNPELLAKEIATSVESIRYKKLLNLGFPCRSFETLQSPRTTEHVSKEMFDYLTALTEEENVLIGIHRTGNSSLDEIANIFKYGFIMHRLNGNTTNSAIHLVNNISYYPNNKTIIKELINADTYRNSLGSILIRIPDEDLTKNIFLIDTETENLILDPKYIIGFIPVGPNGSLTEIITPYTTSNGIFKSIDSLYSDREYARNEQNYKKNK